jgi:hypothetical protein
MKKLTLVIVGLLLTTSAFATVTNDQIKAAQIQVLKDRLALNTAQQTMAADQGVLNALQIQQQIDAATATTPAS